MTQKYYAPSYEKEHFHCLYCKVYAQQKWSNDAKFPIPYQNEYYFHDQKSLIISRCAHCNQSTLWLDKDIIYPQVDSQIQPHEDMPENLKKDFNEAVLIVNKSPRGAAALLRLVVQKLMIELGEKGKDINQDIASLVSKGLDPHIQQALDYCRVIGNNAVHPGKINLEDSPEIAQTLFEMINYIIEDLIARPKKIRDRFETLPEGARARIEERDKPKI